MTVPPPLRRLLALAPLLLLVAASPARAAAPTALAGRAVQALAWFGGTAYAGTDEGLYRLGASGWAAVSQVPSTRSVQALAVVGSTMVAGLDDGAIRSVDGATWSSAGLSGHSAPRPPARGATLLAGTGHEGRSDGLALRSDDVGSTWAPSTTLSAAEGMPGARVQAVLAPASGQPAVAGTAGSGLLRSADGRGGWSDASAGLSSRWVTSLWRDPASPSTVLAGTDDGLDQSGGGAWSLAAFPEQDPWVQALATSSSGAPLVGTYDGAAYQRGGSGWTALGSGLPSVLSLAAVPPAEGGGVLAGTFDGVFCLGCSGGLAAAGAAPSARPGATALPPVAARPGQSPGASPAAGVGATSPLAAITATATATAGATGAPAGDNTGHSGSGLPPYLYALGAALVGLSGVVTARGRRRNRK